MTIEPRSSTVSIAGRAVYYRDWGPPDAPVLVLLHGLMGNSHEWDAVASQVAVDRRVVVPDQRGHGSSDWGDRYTADRLVEDLSAFVDELGLEAFDLAGHSMGGVVSMLYAAAPASRARSVTILDIGPGSLDNHEAREGFLETLAAMEQASYDDLDEVIAAWLAEDPGAQPGPTRAWAEHALGRGPGGRWVWRLDTARVGEFLTHAPGERRLWAALERIAVPTLVVHGEHSWALPAAVAQEMGSRLADGRVVRIDGAAHDLGVGAPDAVARQLGAFLREVSPAARHVVAD